MRIDAIVAAKSVADPQGYRADRRRGMGRSDAEVAYLARLRQRLSVASRTGDKAAYRTARKDYDAYQRRAAKAALSLKEGGGQDA